MSIPEVESRNRLIAFLQGALKKLNSLTIGNYTFPTSDGTNNQVLTTDGNGTLTFENAGGGGGGGISWDGSTANGVATYKDADEATVEANLTFDGSTLTVTGDIEASGDLTVTGNDIKGSGGTAITMDASNNVTVGGDTLQVGTSGYSRIHDSAGANRIYFATSTPETYLYAGDAGSPQVRIKETEFQVDVGLRLEGATIDGPVDSNLTIRADGSIFFDCDEDNDTGGGFYWRNGANTTVALLDDSGHLQIDGDLTADGGDLVAQSSTGGFLVLQRNDSDIVTDESLGSVLWRASEDGTNASYAAGIRALATEDFVYPTNEGTKLEFLTTPDTTGLYTPNMTLSGNGDLQVMGDLMVVGNDIKDSSGNARLTFAQAPGPSTTVTGDLFVTDHAGLNACRIGAATTDPGDNNLYVEGNCTLGDSASDTVTVTGDLFVNDYARIDALRVGTTSTDPGDGNLYIEGTTTAVGQVVPGYDPGILAQNIFDPSSWALYTIVNDEDYLYIVDWDAGATSTTDPKVAFSAPTSGKVIVDVSCYIDDTSTSGAGPYIYAALSTTFGGAGTKIDNEDASIVGNGEKIIWYPDESDRGVRNFSFYVSGLTGGDTYTWYLYMRRWNDGDSNRVICGGQYPMFEMRVRPIYSSALIYTT